jgi:hypothetical protein
MASSIVQNEPVLLLEKSGLLHAIWRWLEQVGRSISSFPALIIAVLIAKIYWTCRDRIGDPDLWWHFRDARYLVEHLRFPNVDMYSFTAAGAPWANHEWLSEIFYYAAFHALGLTGVFILFVSAVAILFVAVFSLCRRSTDDPVAAAVATMCGVFLAMVGFTPRAQHFGWLCFIALYAILLRFRSEKRGPLWLIPPIFCVWVNCHGSWLIGLAVYAIFVVSGLVRSDVGQLVAAPWSKSELRKLVAIGLTSITALLVNPVGYRVLLFPFDLMFRQEIGVANVEEWASVNFNVGRGKFVALVLGAIFASALVARKRWRIDDALLAAFVTYCGLSHIRFLLLAGIVLPPILAAHLGRISSYNPARERRVLNSVLLASIVGVCVWGFPSARMLEKQVADDYPVRAVQFLRAHPERGHMFNFYNWGGFLEWSLPQAPTFVDSRNDVFEHRGVMKDYMDAAYVTNTQAVLDRYQVSYILYPAGSPLAYFLSKSSEWQCVYSDAQSVIYTRAQKQPAA